MHRTYTTFVPSRPEMLNILRTAFDNGITCFNCANDYGPFENERNRCPRGDVSDRDAAA